MKTALATCLALCLCAADVNGQDVTSEQQYSLEGITWFEVSAKSRTYSSDSYEDDRYIKDLVELNLRKYGISVVAKPPQDTGYAILFVLCSEYPDFWKTTLRVNQFVHLLNRNIATKKQNLHFGTTYDIEAFTDSKQEGIEKVLTTFLNNYLAVNEKYRDKQMIQPSPTPASNQLYPFPSNRRATEPSNVIQVGGIGG